MWSLHPDGTLRASNNRTDQCLTAERGEPSPASPAGSVVDIFAGALADGSAAVLFFNRGSDAASSGLNLSELPGFDSDVKTATVRDVWAKADLKKATGGAAEFWKFAATRRCFPPNCQSVILCLFLFSLHSA